MRSLLPIVGVLLVFFPLVGSITAATMNTAAAPAPAPVAAAPASAADNEAAAKHARRTACLKEAKAKKLLGDHKSAFLRECIATH